MIYNIVTGDRIGYSAKVCYVALDNSTHTARCTVEEIWTANGHVVENGYIMTQGQQFSREMAAYETAAPRNESSHL
jgi:hypothetical protein